ncbi:hypothetical protein UFOVP222_10 [uncultured Caudovirales phage]|uniref:Uncharacterized protein n=1 Tax=uncultured Caudovirales phage TaxID=2100421 RepID=A0A6J7WMH3_9CAUD|nr:hypothetical protein UFOVP108_5 [uncultured Caudovirales phage]CAB5218947.1 hypothetical protein UFOVP222_10 [uncultured Caudovirales phage]
MEETAEVFVSGVKIEVNLQTNKVWKYGADQPEMVSLWVSPQCVECGNVEEAETLEQLTTYLTEHQCDWC